MSGLFHRSKKDQAEDRAGDPAVPPTASNSEAVLQKWNEILSMIRGTHPKCRGNPQYLMGVEEGYGLRYIPAKDLYHVLVTGITGCGKSLTFETKVLVFDATEEKINYMPIGDFAHRHLNVPRDEGSLALPERYFALSMDPGGKVGWKPITSIHVHKSPNRIFRITTGGGNVLAVTGDHSVLTLQGSEILPKKGIDLRRGDVLFAPRAIAPPLQKSQIGTVEVTPAFARLLGYYVSEGSVSRTAPNHIQISTTDSAIAEDIKNICAELGFLFKMGKNGKSVWVKAPRLRDFVTEHFGSNARSKRIPPDLLLVRDEAVSQFLSGYYSGDGWVEQDAVCALSASKALIEGLSVLLKRFGIRSTSRERKVSARGPFYELRVCGILDVRKFAEKISFVQPRWQSKLERIANSESTPSPDYDVFPVGGAIEKARRKLFISRKSLGEIAGASQSGVSLICSQKRRLGREHLKKIVCALEQRISALEELKRFEPVLRLLAETNKNSLLEETAKILTTQGTGVSYRTISRLSGISQTSCHRTLTGKTLTGNIYPVAWAVASLVPKRSLPNPLRKFADYQNLSSAQIQEILSRFKQTLFGKHRQRIPKNKPRFFGANAKRLLDIYSRLDLDGARAIVEGLKVLADADLIPEEIKEVEEVEPSHTLVYDFSVADSENFFAEGVFVHNSVWLLSQIVQDILRGNSVFVFDPHGDLAEKLLTHIPRDRWDDVVYVNPLTAKEYGRVVRYNFLEAKEGEEPTITKRSFMDALQKNYPDFWGPRLDAILSHAIDLMFGSSETPTLPKLGRVLSKKTYRDNLLRECRDEDVKDFWHLTFPKYRDDAITAAQNKLYRILEEVVIEPITSAKHSTIDFWNLMQGGKIVIFDIREGALTPEITSFIGTLFLARIYQAGMAREKVPEEERKYVRVYVDEASRFMTNVLKENMQALRKYNVFLTVVCQNLDQFLEGLQGRGGLSQYASTIVAFQSSHETARAVEGFFPKLPADRPEHRHEHLERAKLYCFYLSTIIGTKRENYYIRSINPGIGENRPEEVIAHSLARYGEAYNVREKHPVVEFPIPDIGPAAYFALTELELRGETTEESLQDKLGRFEKGAITDALFVLNERGFATYEWKKGQKANQRFWRITEKGMEYLYPTARIQGDRLGGAKHIAMLCLACRLYREMGFYPVIIGGKREYDTVTIQEGQKKIDLYPDILLYPQYYVSSTRCNPTAWDTSRTIAVEIEAYPRGGRYTGAHLDRTRAHFVKARDVLKLPAIFVVQTEADASAVREALEKEGAKVVPNVHEQYAPGNVSIRVLGKDYDEAIGRGMQAGTRLAMQVRALAEMSRQADISEVAEPEDYYEGEKVPEYASHKWFEERTKIEEEAGKAAAEEARKGEAAVKTEGEGRAGEKTPAHEDMMSDPRRARILECLKDGMSFWDEGGVLVARKEAEGAIFKTEIGPIDGTIRKLLGIFDITLQVPAAGAPAGAAPAEPRRETEGEKGVDAAAVTRAAAKIAKLHAEGGWSFWAEKLQGQNYLYAGRVVNGNLERVPVWHLDDVCRGLIKELGVIVRDSPPEVKPTAEKIEISQPVESQRTGPPKEQKVQPTPHAAPPPPKKLPAERQEASIEPAEDRETKVKRLKQMGARFRKKLVSGREYACALVFVDGKRRELSLGSFDEEIKRIFREEGIYVG